MLNLSRGAQRGEQRREVALNREIDVDELCGNGITGQELIANESTDQVDGEPRFAGDVT